MARSAKPKLSRGEARTPLLGSELDRRLRTFAVELRYVYRSLRRHGVSAIDAEDLAQEVFLIAWRRRADFDRSRPLRPWLAGIAFKLAHQHHRRRPREILAEQDEGFESEPATELQPETLETRALVLRVLANLPERHRSVLVMHELDGLSVETIAGLWAVPRFTLYTRLRRARRAFVEEIRRLEPGSDRRPARASAAALLALEREVPPAPAAVTARLMKRLKNEAAIAPLPDPTPVPATPLLVRCIPILGASAGLCLAIGLLALLLSRPSSSLAVEAARSPARQLVGVRTGRALVRPVRLLIADTTASAAPVEAASELVRDLVGFWPFDDGPGSTTAADRSVGGRACQLRDLDPTQAWIPGLRGGAVELGFNGWLECPQPDLSPRRPVAITVAVWIRRGGTPPLHRALAVRSMEGAGNYFFFGFAGDQLTVASSGWSGNLSVPFREPAGRWVHVAFTHEAGHALKLYVGGLEVARRKTSPRKFSAVQDILRVGAGLQGSEQRRVGQRFEGALDELRVYERALPDTEIRALAALAH